MAKKVPKYQKVSGRNKARVLINGKQISLKGDYNSPESKQHYRELIAEYLLKSDEPERIQVSIAAIAVAYLKHATEYYGDNTTEIGLIRSSVKPAIEFYGTEPLGKMTPAKFKKIREVYIDNGCNRATCNAYAGRFLQMMKWAVEQCFIEPQVHLRCQAVKILTKGHSRAPEPGKVRSIPAKTIKALKPYVNRQIYNMMMLQLRSGMRPQEVRLLRECDILMNSKKIWHYVPYKHKTENKGKDRNIFFGPKAIKILKQFLAGDLSEDGYLFSPNDAYEESLAARRTEAALKTLSPKERKPRSSKHYTKDSYGKAVKRGCKAAGVEEFGPNRIRHTAATKIRAEIGLDDARAVAGHSEKTTTEIYAEPDVKKHRKAMRKMG